MVAPATQEHGDWAVPRFWNERNMAVLEHAPANEVLAYFDAHMRKNEQEIDEFAQHEQGGLLWLEDHNKRVTGSRLGDAVDCGYEDSETCAQKILHGGTVPLKNVQWGKDHEDVAAELLVLNMAWNTSHATRYAWHQPLEGVFMTHEGLRLWTLHNGIGVSSDGRLYMGHCVLNVELKCPSSKKIYAQLPPAYYCQHTGQLLVQRLPATVFAVYTPHEMLVELRALDYEFAVRFLIPSVLDFYWNFFLPRHYLMHTKPDLLKPGQMYLDDHVRTIEFCANDPDLPNGGVGFDLDWIANMLCARSSGDYSLHALAGMPGDNEEDNADAPPAEGGDVC